MSWYMPHDVGQQRIDCVILQYFYFYLSVLTPSKKCTGYTDSNLDYLMTPKNRNVLRSGRNVSSKAAEAKIGLGKDLFFERVIDEFVNSVDTIVMIGVFLFVGTYNF